MAVQISHLRIIEDVKGKWTIKAKMTIQIDDFIIETARIAENAEDGRVVLWLAGVKLKDNDLYAHLTARALAAYHAMIGDEAA